MGRPSTIRSLTSRVLSQGYALRPRWSPQADSAHWRVYNWWLNKTGRKPRQENFCHYWRVVLIWAPLRWMLKPFLWVLAATGLISLVWLFIAQTSVALGIVVGMSAFLYIWYSVHVILQLLHEITGAAYFEPVNWLNNKSFTIKWLAVVSALPIILFTGTIGLVCGSIVAVALGLHEDYDIYRRFGRWFFGAHLNHKIVSWVRPWMSIPVAIVVLCLTVPAFWSFVLAILPPVIFVVVIGGIILFASFISEILGERRVERMKLRSDRLRREQNERLLRVIFSVTQPEQADNEGAFLAWKQEYSSQVQWETGHQVWELGALYHLSRLTDHNQEVIVKARFLDVKGSPIEEVVTKPNAFEKFFLRIGATIMTALRKIGTTASDFLSLIWSIVLTRKWRICPWVDLPVEEPERIR